MPSPLIPEQSAVVAACAGSGKTWLLVSRLIRLLLAGVPPSELLAITFTRKAAEEMRERLFLWLRVLATEEEAVVRTFLVQRGLTETEATHLMPKARGLYEAVLASVPGPMITTFHGWFLNLLSRAPLSSRVPGNLIEDMVLLRAEAWQTWVESLRAPDKAVVAEALTGLLARLPLASVKALLFGMLAGRAEWWAWSDGCADPVLVADSALSGLAGLDEGRDVLGEMWCEPGFTHLLDEFRPLLAVNAVAVRADVERLAALDAALAGQGSGVVSLASAFLTKDGEAVSRKVGAALQGRLGVDGAARFVELHYVLAERVQQARYLLAEQEALRLNRLALTAGHDLIRHFQGLKQARDGLDFTDAEWLAAKLLADPEESAALLAKLDARWRHVLLDEFQDANPLQWRILTAWLSAYGDDPERPTVFMVGDPKQSIYRFRGAEPRLFDMAAGWLETHFAAQRVQQNVTRRCAPRVVAWVNAVFGGLGEAYPGFVGHEAHSVGLHGWCELIVAPSPPAALTGGEGSGLRNPLTEAPPSWPDKRAEEAAWVAQRILDVVGRLEVAEDNGRPARFADILVLSASRTGLAGFEAAFKAVGIPYLSSRRGGLLDSLEAGDLMAVLGVLASPSDDLKLARVLKCPLFGLSDADLLALSAVAEGAWIVRLRRWVEAGSASDSACRALALLDAWREAAGQLPPHDLLDRIVHEGEAERRYAAAASDQQRASVLANLHGFVDYSLRLGGGRFPSLPHFLDELAALAEDAGDDAPDEPPAATGDAVRMLTIHAAKGLEAPMVFLIKADEARRGQDHYGLLVDWPPEAERPRHVSVYGPSAMRGKGRAALFDTKAALAERENLNLLYVAMTRAKQAMFVSGLDEAKDGSWMALLRQGLDSASMAGLPEMGFALSDREDGEVTDSQGLQDGYVAPSPPALFALQGTPPEGEGGVGRRRAPSTPEIDFGIHVHRYLELATVAWPDSDIRADLGLDAERHAVVRDVARRILGNPDTSRFFTDGRAHNEMAYVGQDGQLRRIDRLVEFDDEVWVLDYKTGGDALAYREQLADYRQAMAALYPGKCIRSALLFGDGGWQEVE